jgi:hypothetical protein
MNAVESLPTLVPEQRDLDGIATELDALYFRLISRIEALVEEADAVDRRLRELFQAESFSNGLDADRAIDPLRPMTPNAAFRLVIGRLLQVVNGRVSSFRTTCSESFEDLLAWGSQESMGRSSDDIRHALAEGRKHSIARAWQDIRLRISPTEDPNQARDKALWALVDGFCVRVHGRILLPYARINGHARLLQTSLNTELRELAYVIAPPQLRTISNTCQSLGTLDALAGDHERGGRMAEVAGKLARHLKTTNGGYIDGDRFGNFRELEILLSRDRAIYEVTTDVFDVIVENLRKMPQHDIEIIQSSTFHA